MRKYSLLITFEVFMAVTIEVSIVRQVSRKLFKTRFVNYKTGNARKRNIEARSSNHCCSGKVVSITYSENVFVTLVIQHAVRIAMF